MKEIVAAMRPLWWLTWIAVWLSTDLAKADSGTIVSAAVLSGLPLDVPPRLLDIAFVAAFACALALSALAVDEAARGATGVNGFTPLTVPACICVCCVPVTLPAAVLR